MIRKRQEIAERVEVTKAGLEGKLGRGFKIMNEYWIEHIAATATRKLGAGRPWRFGAHQAELQRRHDAGRGRGNAVDNTYLQHEWEDRLEMIIELLKKSQEK